jgi:hypothetical protein
VEAHAMNATVAAAVLVLLATTALAEPL